MKKLLVISFLFLLTGCVAYPAYYDGYPTSYYPTSYYPTSAYRYGYVGPDVSISVGGGYSGHGFHHGGRGFHSGKHFHGGGHWRGWHR